MCHIQGDRLPLDWRTRKLFSHTCPLLAAKLSLSHLMLSGLSQYHSVFSLVVLDIHTSMFSVVVLRNSIVLNGNYSYTISLHNILHGGNATGSILTVQCCVKQDWRSYAFWLFSLDWQKVQLTLVWSCWS